ncbi:MAG: hypothetical protein Q7T20_18750 [Saprospiraceae bacterium]|nr:hypothetical protein [Saprospiraceae bacterium]
MKHLTTLLVFAAIFNSISVSAQKNRLTAGLFYLPTCGENVAHGSLGYFRTLEGKHSIGLKTSLSTDAMEVPKNYPRDYIVSTELVHRWSFRSMRRPSQWHLDAGLAVRSQIKKIPAHQFMECIMGMTEAELRSWEAYNSTSHVEASFRPGIATAASWEYALSEHFSLGFGVMANVYITQKEPNEFLIMPSLTTSYRF